MISITKQQLDLLIALQENEREEARLNAELKRMPEKKAQMEASLKSYEQDIQTRQERLAAFKKDYRAYDNELELNQSRIKKREVQLHSVKTNKEYQSLLKEIDEIRSSSSRLEDVSLPLVSRRRRISPHRTGPRGLLQYPMCPMLSL